jgi:hypothetical protein
MNRELKSNEILDVYTFGPTPVEPLRAESESIPDEIRAALEAAIKQDQSGAAKEAWRKQS